MRMTLVAEQKRKRAARKEKSNHDCESTLCVSMGSFCVECNLYGACPSVRVVRLGAEKNVCLVRKEKENP